MELLFEFVSAIGEALVGVIPIYDQWCLLGILAIFAGVGLYRLFEWVATTSSGRGRRERLNTIRQIASLSRDEIEDLRRKNQPELVDVLVQEARETLTMEEELSGKPHNKMEAARHRNLRQRADINLKVLPERYRALKEGRQFSQYRG